VISVGVSGHRALDDSDKIVNLVDDALEKIVIAFDDRLFKIISPLAEGADRLVVWRALANHGAHLLVPLPMALSEYMQDFPSITSKVEFITLLEQAERVIELPYASTREACYLAAGKYVLDNSDVLLAIWDGKAAKGLGGTAEIVKEARERDLPIVWIHTNPQDLERITLENFHQGNKT